MADKSVDVINAKTLRLKYVGAKLNEATLEEYLCFHNKETGETSLEFSVLVDWSGDEYTFEVEFVLDDQLTIRSIKAPSCKKLTGDGTFGSSYRGQKMDEFNYYKFDREFSKRVIFAT